MPASASGCYFRSMRWATQWRLLRGSFRDAVFRCDGPRRARVLAPAATSWLFETHLRGPEHEPSSALATDL